MTKFDPANYGPSLFPKEIEVGTVKHIIFKKEVVTIYYCSDGLWRDITGCIYGLPSLRCGWTGSVEAGVGCISLPENCIISKYSKVHDYMYSSPVAQLFYTRKEADKMLYRIYGKLPKPERIVQLPFYYLTRMFGWLFWENPNSR